MSTSDEERILSLQVPMMAGRDEWLEEAMSKVSSECLPTMVDSEHPLFLLYTSGSTGKPKGVRLKPKNTVFFSNYSA